MDNELLDLLAYELGEIHRWEEGSPRTRTTTKYRSEQCKRAATDIPSVAALLYYKS